MTLLISPHVSYEVNENEKVDIANKTNDRYGKSHTQSEQIYISTEYSCWIYSLDLILTQYLSFFPPY